MKSKTGGSASSGTFSLSSGRSSFMHIKKVSVISRNNNDENSSSMVVAAEKRYPPAKRHTGPTQEDLVALLQQKIREARQKRVETK